MVQQQVALFDDVKDGSALIQRDRDRHFVFVQRDAHTFEARDVRLGDSNGKQVAIVEGLRDGERVVTNGGFILKSELMGEDL